MEPEWEEEDIGGEDEDGEQGGKDEGEEQGGEEEGEQGAHPDSVHSILFHLFNEYLSETLYDWLMGHSWALSVYNPKRRRRQQKTAKEHDCIQYLWFLL